MSNVSESTVIPNIKISAKSHFVPQQSDITSSRYVYSYTINIENNTQTPYQLLSRHWVIQDANMKVEEVYGEGVLGEQPLIEPGASYSYTSGAVLATDMGTMEGKYYFLAPDNTEKNRNQVEVAIPKFLLTIPRTVH